MIILVTDNFLFYKLVVIKFWGSCER